jgi:hypothetical protein
MINLFAILFSSIMVLYIMLRAARLDRVRPWFDASDQGPGTIADQTAMRLTRKNARHGAYRPPIGIDSAKRAGGSRPNSGHHQ